MIEAVQFQEVMETFPRLHFIDDIQMLEMLVRNSIKNVFIDYAIHSFRASIDPGFK